MIFPETRQKMLSNAVSLVQIALLSPEFFASKEQNKSVVKALICDYFGPELISGLMYRVSIVRSHGLQTPVTMDT